MAITSNPINQNGALITGQGTKTFFNITANTLVKASRGRVARISVIVAGSGNGSVHDAATIGAAGATNNLAAIPFAAIGILNIDMPVSNGIVVKPGTGQTLAISYI
jgi:hypothetical protein